VAVGHDLARPAGSGSHDGQAGGHAFDHHQAEALGDHRGLHQHVQPTELGTDVLPEAGHLDATLQA
jgi:hypothetical protein